MTAFTLMESDGRHRGSSSKGVTVLSVAAHAAIIGAAVLYTVHAGIVKHEEHPTVQRMVFVAPPPPVVKAAPPPPAPHKAAPRSVSRKVYVAPRPVLEPPPVTVPTITTIPISIAPPRVDVPATVFDTLGKGGVRSGTGGNGVVGSGGAGDAGGSGVFTAETVDIVARADPRHSVVPVYPQVLQESGVQGTVVAQFVVDQDGRVDMSTFKVISSDNTLFTGAVRASLVRTRYIPAQSNGRTVRQLVQQPFSFNILHQ